MICEYTRSRCCSRDRYHNVYAFWRSRGRILLRWVILTSCLSSGTLRKPIAGTPTPSFSPYDPSVPKIKSSSSRYRCSIRVGPASQFILPRIHAFVTDKPQPSRGLTYDERRNRELADETGNMLRDASIDICHVFYPSDNRSTTPQRSV